MQYAKEITAGRQNKVQLKLHTRNAISSWRGRLSDISVRLRICWPGKGNTHVDSPWPSLLVQILAVGGASSQKPPSKSSTEGASLRTDKKSVMRVGQESRDGCFALGYSRGSHREESDKRELGKNWLEYKNWAVQFFKGQDCVLWGFFVFSCKGNTLQHCWVCLKIL